MNDEYDGQIEECSMCGTEIYIDSIFDEWKWIDGLGFLCVHCMSLEEYSSPDEFNIDEDIDSILDEIE